MHVVNFPTQLLNAKMQMGKIVSLLPPRPPKVVREEIKR